VPLTFYFIIRQRINALEDPEAALQAFLARQPMARFGTPEEIAAAAAFLASDEVFENLIVYLFC
jgi:NAD(P)-dependent dehydrogenase (short-subunit alcohol dehydrogenase family)